MKKSKVPRGKGRVLVCACQPISRRLRNGDILTAYSEPARLAEDPMLVVDELERQWKEGRG